MFCCPHKTYCHKLKSFSSIFNYFWFQRGGPIPMDPLHKYTTLVANHHKLLYSTGKVSMRVFSTHKVGMSHRIELSPETSESTCLLFLPSKTYAQFMSPNHIIDIMNEMLCQAVRKTSKVIDRCVLLTPYIKTRQASRVVLI